MNEPDTETQSPYIVFTVAGQSYAVSHACVMEMVQPPSVVPVPGTPKEVLGVINLRGQVMGVVDFRVAIGLPSLASETQELIEALRQREQEHKAWLSELEASIREDRDFRKTTDPHACAFGRWFDNFSTNNQLLAQTVNRFGEPHARIHGIAQKARALYTDGDQDGALAVIENTRHGDLATMIALFAQTREMLETMQREIAIIVRLKGGTTVAMVVDSVDAIRALSVHPNADGNKPTASQVTAMVSGIATTHTDDLILVVDPAAMLPMMASIAA